VHGQTIHPRDIGMTKEQLVATVISDWMAS